MPRVKLGTPTPAQQRAVMNKVIKKAMVDCDIEDYTALGLRMGIQQHGHTQNCVAGSCNMRTRAWNLRCAPITRPLRMRPSVRT